MGVTSQQLQRVLGPFNSLRHSLHLKSPAISPFSNSNMKAFTMLGLVFVVVASAMFAKATDDEPGLCKVKWGEKMKKCQQGNEVDSLQRACCKNEGVPEECSAYCDPAYLLSNILKNQPK